MGFRRKTPEESDDDSYPWFIGRFERFLTGNITVLSIRQLLKEHETGLKTPYKQTQTS